MDIRPAEPADRSSIAAIARESFRSSYALSPGQIETIVDEEFAEGTLAGRLEDPDVSLLVAEDADADTDGVQGFVDVVGGSERTIRWLHVDPQSRGSGVATALLERVGETDPGTPLAARILEDAVEGGEFLEGFGLEPDGNDEMELGGEEFAVDRYAEGNGTEDGNEPTVPVPESVDAEGAERPLDRDEQVAGRDAPFFPTYAGEARTDAYGYFCSNCGGTDVSADGLDRLECGECGNLHLADEWDDSYL